MDDRVKFEIEFPIQASPQLLYQYISTPSGLSEWYSDNVNSRGELFTFIWDDSEEEAKLLSKKAGERAITKDVSLMITDFADDDEEADEAKMLWENQISSLKQVLGSA